jgi:hypothetical protein
MKSFPPSQAVLLSLVAVVACSPPPNTVQPTLPPQGHFNTVSCNAIASTIEDLVRREAELVEAQTRAFAADTAAVLIVGPPLGRMAGMNRAQELGATRGLLISANERATQCAR